MPSLLVISGPLEGEKFDVDGTVVVGRRDADIVIDDPELSRRHLEIRVVDDGLVIEDLDSTNGTFVNDRAIEAPTRLRPGDRFVLGLSVLELEVVSDPDVTRVRQAPVAGLDDTRMRSISRGRAEPVSADGARATNEPASTAPVEASAQAPQDAMAPFRPPVVRHGGGLASRSWVPVLLSFSTAILTAIVLVVYFAQR